METEGYRTCKCGNQALDVVAYQTGGVCLDCFIKGDVSRLREVELIQRATVTRARRPPANSPKKNHRKRKSANEAKAHLAQGRALRRLRWLFPDVYDVLLAEERHRDGLAPRPHRSKDHLKEAVETYTAFVAYHSAANRSDDGATQA